MKNVQWIISGVTMQKQLLTVNLLTSLIKIKLGLLEGNPSFLFYTLIK